MAAIQGTRLPIRVVVTTGAHGTDRLAAVQDLGPDALLSEPGELQGPLRHLGSP